jgi:hypothetical protein
MAVILCGKWALGMGHGAWEIDFHGKVCAKTWREWLT